MENRLSILDLIDPSRQPLDEMIDGFRTFEAVVSASFVSASQTAKAFRSEMEKAGKELNSFVSESKGAGVKALEDLAKKTVEAKAAQEAYNSEAKKAQTEANKLKKQQILLKKAIQGAEKAKREATEATEGSIKALRNEVKEKKKEAEALRQGTKEHERANAEYIEAKKRLDAYNKSQREAVKENKFAAGSLRDLAKQLGDLRGEYKSLSAAERQGAKGREMLKKIQALDEEVKDLDASVGQFQRNVGNYASALQGFGGAAGSAGAVIEGFLAGGALGAGAAALSAVGEQFSALAQAVQETNKQVRETQTLFSELTQRQAAELQSRIATIATTFQVDFNETLTASNALAKQLGISSSEAMDLIEDGFARGANINGEFLSQLQEYPAQYKNAGLSAQEFVDTAIVASQQGVFSDKLIDSVKEFGLQITEQTPAVRDALTQAFGGAFTDDLLDRVNRGKTTVSEALSEVSAKTKETNLTQKQLATITADVFGAAGEDAGGFLKIIETLDKVEKERNRTLTEAERRTMRVLEANKETNALFTELSQIFSDNSGEVAEFAAALKNIGLKLLINIVKGVIRNFKQMYNAAKAVADGFSAIAGGIDIFKGAWEGIEYILTGAFIEDFQTAISGFHAALSAIFDELVKQGKQLMEAFEALKDLDFSKAKEKFKTDFSGIGEVAAKAFSDEFAKVEEAERASAEAEWSARSKAAYQKAGENSGKAFGTAAAKEQAKALESSFAEIKSLAIARLEIENEALKRTAENEEEALQKRIEAYKMYGENIKAIEAEKTAIVRNELDTQQISEAAYQEKVLRLRQESARESIALANERASVEKELLNKNIEEQIKGSLELTESLIEVEEERIEMLNEVAEEAEKAPFFDFSAPEKREEIIQAARSLTSQVVGLFAEQTARRRQEAEKQVSILEAQKEKELALAGNNARLREQIEARFEAKQRQVAKKQAERERKLFIVNKLFSAGEVVIDTAKGITKALAALNPVLAGIIGASGAVQLATILARQPPAVPSFFKGSKKLELEGARPGIDTIPGLYNSRSGRRSPVMLNEGEAIIPTEQANIFRPLTDAIIDKRVRSLDDAAVFMQNLRGKTEEKATFVSVNNVIDTEGVIKNLREGFAGVRDEIRNSQVSLHVFPGRVRMNTRNSFTEIQNETYFQ